MPDNICVTIAPTRHITIAPHPSGLSQLRSLVLREGDALRVSQEEADRLYADGTILHPVTGQPRPAPRERSGPVMIRGDGTIVATHDASAMSPGELERRMNAEIDERNRASGARQPSPAKVIRHDEDLGPIDPATAGASFIW